MDIWLRRYIFSCKDHQSCLFVCVFSFCLAKTSKNGCINRTIKRFHVSLRLLGRDEWGKPSDKLLKAPKPNCCVKTRNYTGFGRIRFYEYKKAVKLLKQELGDDKACEGKMFGKAMSYSNSNEKTRVPDFNANDVTSSFDQLKVIYKKVGNNESQAFGVWQQLSDSGRTAAFAHTQRLQGDLSSRSYLYVYLRDKEWMKVM